MTEYSRWAKGTYTVSGGSVGVSAPNVKVINLPFQPNYVELMNLTAAITPTDDGIPFAYWDASSLVTVSGTVYNPTIVQQFNATPVLLTDSVLTNGISAFSAGQMLQYGPTQAVSSIAHSTSPTIVTTSSAHGYSVGDTVVITGITFGSNNMQLLNSVPFTISAVGSTTTFSIKWDSSGSNYADFTGVAATVVRKVLYPFLYPPEDNVISAITLGTTTTVTTTMYHNFEVGQEIAFRIPTSWGTTQLNSLPNVQIPGSPIYGYVVSITDNWTFVCSINSASFTAYTDNFTMTASTLVGLSYPQVLSAGDVNTGGALISSGSPLYPSSSFPTSTNRVSTINGPAIRGAFVNNTSQGFIVGAGACHTDTTSWLGGQDGDIMEWRAYYFELSSP